MHLYQVFAYTDNSSKIIAVQVNQYHRLTFLDHIHSPIMDQKKKRGLSIIVTVRDVDKSPLFVYYDYVFLSRTSTII